MQSTRSDHLITQVWAKRQEPLYLYCHLSDSAEGSDSPEWTADICRSAGDQARPEEERRPLTGGGQASGRALPPCAQEQAAAHAGVHGTLRNMHCEPEQFLFQTAVVRTNFRS